MAAARLIPGVTRKKFLYNLSRSSYEKEWGTEYHKPGLGTRILAFFFRWLPGTVPFTALKIRTPAPEVEKLFMASFNATGDRYKVLLANVSAGSPELPNENFDAGGATSSFVITAKIRSLKSLPRNGSSGGNFSI